MSKINRDKISNADPKQVSKAAFSVLDRLQNFPAWMQPMAAAAVMLLLCQGYGKHVVCLVGGHAAMAIDFIAQGKRRLPRRIGEIVRGTRVEDGAR